MTDFFLLVCGLVGLWLGSETLIRGAMSLADRYQVSDAVFGMFVLAMGTDLPELFVAFDASVKSLAGEDLSGIVVGSAIGSCIGQFGLVFGTAGFVGYAARPRHLWRRNTLFLLGGLTALFLFSLNGTISRLEGMLLVIFYGGYLYTLVVYRPEGGESESHPTPGPAWRAWITLAIGTAILLLAAELTVVSAIGFGETVGLSDVAVSAIVIGMGSSLPELAVSFVALLRKRGGLSVGNLMGSNVLDTLLVPGIAAGISPLVVPVEVLWIDLPFMALVTVLVLLFLYVTRRGVRAPEAAALLAIYCVYVFVRLVGPGSQLV